MKRPKRPASTNPCLICMRHHEPPQCDWDADALCPTCGLQVWYKGDDAQPGPECYWCWSGLPRTGGGGEREQKKEMDLPYEVRILGA